MSLLRSICHNFHPTGHWVYCCLESLHIQIIAVLFLTEIPIRKQILNSFKTRTQNSGSYFYLSAIDMYSFCSTYCGVDPSRLWAQDEGQPEQDTHTFKNYRVFRDVKLARGSWGTLRTPWKHGEHAKFLFPLYKHTYIFSNNIRKKIRLALNSLKGGC